EFYDTAALVWFARIIQWDFPGLSVENCLPQIWQAQTILEENGRISGRIHRFMLVGRRCGEGTLGAASPQTPGQRE
ncbi:MAG: hypothetical protein IJ466_10165, partial [Clostridia bacterium]|nr:hypothetical protein [Clostridia bacterium]